MLQILIIFIIAIFIISLIVLIPLFLNQKQMKKYKLIEAEYKKNKNIPLKYEVINNHDYKLKDDEKMYIKENNVNFYKIKNNYVIKNILLYNDSSLFTLKENFNFRHINHVNMGNNMRIYVSNKRIVLEDKMDFFIYFYVNCSFIKTSILKINNEYKKGITIIDKNSIYFLEINNWNQIFMIDQLYKDVQ